MKVLRVRYSYPHYVRNDCKRGLRLWVVGSMGACGSGLRISYLRSASNDHKRGFLK